MGMSASQYNSGFLISRSNTIGRNLMQLSNDKRALTRDMQKVSKEYQEALTSKVLKWSNNSGVTYSDLSYGNLMYPSEMNQDTPYLLTDNKGQIVIDSKYKKYAEMISPDGSAKGDYESNRSAILSELTGIDEAKINSVYSNEAAVIEAKAYLDSLEEPKRNSFLKNTSAIGLLEKMKSTANFNKSVNWSQAYRTSDSIDLGYNVYALSTVKSIFSTLEKTLSPYFMENAEAFKTACETKLTDCINLINSQIDLSNSAGMIQGKSNNYHLDVVQVIEQVLSAADVETGTSNDGTTPVYTWFDIDNKEAYEKYKADYADYETKRKAAEETYNAAISADNQLLSAPEESKIAFYDAIFSSIAEKGWTYNNQVNDTEYLNQMLQNNLYTLTTVERTSEYDCKKDKFNWFNDYKTDIASNFTNVFQVSDSDLRNQALAEYEHKKAIISEKETRIDTRMQDLQTEQAAIKQMIQGIESVRNDNIERNFSIMG